MMKSYQSIVEMTPPDRRNTNGGGNAVVDELSLATSRAAAFAIAPPFPSTTSATFSDDLSTESKRLIGVGLLDDDDESSSLSTSSLPSSSTPSSVTMFTGTFSSTSSLLSRMIHWGSSSKTTSTTSTKHYRRTNRLYFVVALCVAMATCLIFLSGFWLDPESSSSSPSSLSEWMENFWELGVSGMRAQRLANAASMSMVHLHADGSSGHGHKGHADKANDNQTTTKESPMTISDGCESTVMLIRHCEKGNLKSHCNYNGYERAVYLSTLFGNGRTERWPAPSHIYALKASRQGNRKHFNYREVETVQFVGEKSHVDIDTNYGTSHGGTKALAQEILQNVYSGNFCGKLILVSWKHTDIPKLAQHLGCGPLEGCPWDYRGKEFDQVWQIRYVYQNFLQDRHNKDNNKKKRNRHWDIFASIQNEYFDPLQFSKLVGDYPPHGTDSGARWVQNTDVKFFD